MKVISCIVARTTSNRLPLKVLRTINKSNDKSILDVIISKAKQSQLTDKIYLCTSTEFCDDILEDVAARNDVNLYRGASEAVIERLIDVADIEQADYIIRITGDNIFVAGEYLDNQIRMCIENDLDYCRLSGVPIGATAELIKVTALKQVYKDMDPSVSEYLMLFIFNPTKYKCGVLKSTKDLSSYGITVDTAEDLENVKHIINILGDEAEQLSLTNICNLFSGNQMLFKKIPVDAMIKLPYEETILFSEFLIDQKKRVGNTQCIESIKII